MFSRNTTQCYTTTTRPIVAAVSQPCALPPLFERLKTDHGCPRYIPLSATRHQRPHQVPDFDPRGAKRRKLGMSFSSHGCVVHTSESVLSRPPSGPPVECSPSNLVFVLTPFSPLCAVLNHPHMTPMLFPLYSASLFGHQGSYLTKWTSCLATLVAA